MGDFLDDFGQMVTTSLPQDWLTSHFVDHDERLPWVPLCRLHINPTIQTTDDHLKELEDIFNLHGYVPVQGDFIVSRSFAGEDALPFNLRDPNWVKWHGTLQSH